MATTLTKKDCAGLKGCWQLLVHAVLEQLNSLHPSKCTASDDHQASDDDSRWNNGETHNTTNKNGRKKQASPKWLIYIILQQVGKTQSNEARLSIETTRQRACRV